MSGQTDGGVVVTGSPGIDLDMIEAQAAAATRGPWRDQGRFYDGPEWGHSVTGGGESGSAASHQVLWVGETLNCNADADAVFIAAARTDVPALTGALRAVRELHQPEHFEFGASQWVRGDARPDQTLCSSCVGENWPCETYIAAGGIA